MQHVFRHINVFCQYGDVVNLSA